MAKRSSFTRKPRDAYDTPPSAVAPLLRHLAPGTRFIEPCAGAFMLAGELQVHRHRCVSAFDIAPRDPRVRRACVSEVVGVGDSVNAFITNPPWPSPGSQGEPVISLALRLSAMRPTWLLLSADFAHNAYFAKLQPVCVKIVSVGRVSWEQNGTAGKDNAAWYLFDASHIGATRFFGRAAA